MRGRNGVVGGRKGVKGGGGPGGVVAGGYKVLEEEGSNFSHSHF